MHPEQTQPATLDEGVPTTGDASVDEVLASMTSLDDLPVDEHVAVFEQAHDRLRRALDARPDS